MLLIRRQANTEYLRPLDGFTSSLTGTDKRMMCLCVRACVYACVYVRIYMCVRPLYELCVYVCMCGYEQACVHACAFV